jgi:hypothetical protein
MSPERWSTLVSTLMTVELLPADACGVVAFGDGASGILVENRRVCWVAAEGLAPRLTDLLSEHARHHGVDLDELYARARTLQKPVGHLLVQHDLLPPATLDRVLRRHSAESLSLLAASAQPLTWRPRSNGGYAARLAYLPEDVLFDVVDLGHPDERARACAELASYADLPVCGVAFALDTRGELSVPLARIGAPGGLERLLAHGRRARTLYRAARELEDATHYALGVTPDAGHTIVWWRGDQLFALSCEDRVGIAQATARYLAKHRSSACAAPSPLRRVASGIVDHAC